MRTLASIRQDALALQNTFSSIEAVERLETELLKMPQTNATVNEYYGYKLYGRELRMRKGTVAVGRVHKHNHISILISGKMKIWTPDEGVHDVVGPSITEVKAGMKRAGYAITDVHWVTAHHLDEEGDPFEILTIGKYNDYLQYIERKQNVISCS